MTKVANHVSNNLRIAVVICIAIMLATLGTYKYNQTYEIKYAYNGIKYQANNSNSGEPLRIEVNGVYKKGYFGNPAMFKGKIIINGEIYYGIYGDSSRGYEYAFNKYKMSQIEGDSFKGQIFINDMFKEMTIEINEVESTGSMKFSYNNGWLISAPAETREQAVKISNKLIQKLHKDVNIK